MNTEELKKAIQEFRDYLESDELSTESEEINAVMTELLDKAQEDPNQENVQALVEAMELHEEMDRELSDANTASAMMLLTQSESNNSLVQKLVESYKNYVEETQTKVSQATPAPVVDTPSALPQEVVTPMPVEPSVAPVAADPMVTTAPIPVEQPAPQVAQSKEEDAQRIEQIMAQLKSLNGTQAN